MRLEIFGGDQMFFLRLQKSLREVDHGCATHINVERRFLDRFALWIEMQLRIGVRAVVHTHRDRAQIYGLPLCDLSRQSMMKRLVAGPFREVIRKRS